MVSNTSNFRNDDGANCAVSYCPPSRNGHYNAGFKFYCGRTVGRSNYHPFQQHCTCDGRCGPDNGCQCRSCFILDQQYAASLTGVTAASMPAAVSNPAPPSRESRPAAVRNPAPPSHESRPAAVRNPAPPSHESRPAAVSTPQPSSRETALATSLGGDSTDASNLCIICCDAQKCIAIIPCGHVVMCQACFDNYTNLNKTNCPMCNQRIQSSLRLYV